MKVLRKIWKNYRNSKRPEDPGSQKERLIRATRWPHLARRGLGQAAPGGGEPTSDTASRRLFAYKMPPDLKLTEQSASVHEKFQSAATITYEIRGTESLCFGTLPRPGIAPGAISIDSTAIFITAADSYDEEGVVLPRG